MQAAIFLPQLLPIFLPNRIGLDRAGSANQMTAAARQFDTFGTAIWINCVFILIIHVHRAVRAFQNAHAARATCFSNPI